jgi:hypothetical protein
LSCTHSVLVSEWIKHDKFVWYENGSICNADRSTHVVGKVIIQHELIAIMITKTKYLKVSHSLHRQYPASQLRHKQHHQRWNCTYKIRKYLTAITHNAQKGQCKLSSLKMHLMVFKACQKPKSPFTDDNAMPNKLL